MDRRRVIIAGDIETKGDKRMNRKMIMTLILVVLSALLLAACGTAVKREAIGTRSFDSQEANVEEISFRSGKFRVVGDLRMPVGEGPHPAIIMVHGSGGATRNGAVPFSPLIEIFLRNGYAVFSWDKPGSGESTGQFSDELTQRADILVTGVEVLTEHPAIDPTRIGLWGISQAGWVMPLAIEQSENVAFMIIVSGAAEDSIEQMAYQIGQKVACDGGSTEQVALVERYWSQRAKATSYDEYREAVQALLEIPGVKGYTGLEMTEEKNWKPWSRDWDSFIDPMEVIEHTTIPMLVFFGELDKNIDPVQGAEAYEAALQKAGNQDYRVVVISEVAHTLTWAKTGCLNESWGTSYAPEFLETMETWLQHLSQ
jgi:pimeloyl-ACP methyl ester carboxylesterase